MWILQNFQQLWRNIVPEQYTLPSGSTSPIPVRQPSSTHTSTPPTGVTLDDHESTKSPQYSSDSSSYIPLPSTPTSSQRFSPPSNIPTNISLNDPLQRVNLHLSNVDSNGGFGHTIQGDQINNFYKNENESRAFERLAERAAPNACYDSEQRYPPPNCHAGTRLQMIADISNWVEDRSKTASALWLHGTAGLGKSAIAQHIAEKYAVSGILGGAFFFSRNDSSRDNIGPFVASLAYQFCKAGSPLQRALGSKIIEAIASDPNVFHTACENQLRKLILEPCSKIIESSLRSSFPYLLIIDGLDECVKPSEQERVLKILRTLLAAHSFPRWNILICSRPEPQIRGVFDQTFVGILYLFDMNTSEELNRDIARYFNDEFSRLRRKYRRVLGIEGAVWPEDHVIDELVRRADKQMIFAVTVIKYIDTPDELPQDQLETVRRIVVETGTGSPYSALDMLYHQILTMCGKWERVQPILSLLVTPHELPPSYNSFNYRTWRSPMMIAQLLNLKEAEVYVVLERLHSVLRLPRDVEDDQDYGRTYRVRMEDSENVHIAHATFNEFLVDLIRSACFHTPRMSKSEYYDCCATSSLKTLSDLAQYYPPYHSQSFTEALSVWEKKRQGIYDRGLSSFVVCGWTLCKEVTTPPSSALVQASLTFDPYPFMTLVESWGLESHMSRYPFYVSLRTQIKWAKTQSPTVSFAQKLKSFVSIEEYYVAFPPGTQGNAVFHGSFHAESLLWYGNQRIANVCKEIPPPRDSDGHIPHLLILPPASSHTSAKVPDDWIVVRMTKDNAKSCSRADDIYDWDEEMFIRDIRNNTRESISLGSAKERDLIHIRKLIKERLEIVRRLPVAYRDGVDPESFWSWVDGIEANTDTYDSETDMETVIDSDDSEGFGDSENSDDSDDSGDSDASNASDSDGSDDSDDSEDS